MDGFEYIKKTTVGILLFSYHEKKTVADSLFTLGKKAYVEKRGMTWTPTKKRPNKLKDSLKELEVYAEDHLILSFCHF